MIMTTFSNGHTDTYKGKREVHAGWAVIERDSGETLCSGHSLDWTRAAKTANNKANEYGADRISHFPSGNPVVEAKYYARHLSERGITPAAKLNAIRAQVKEWNAECNAKFHARYRIEIVAVANI